MSTAASIYATTLFTHLADHILGKYAERWSAVFLTAATLFFVELLPKNIGVINAERVGEFRRGGGTLSGGGWDGCSVPAAAMLTGPSTPRFRSFSFPPVS